MNILLRRLWQNRRNYLKIKKNFKEKINIFGCDIKDKKKKLILNNFA